MHAAANSPYFAKDPEVVAQNKINSVPMKRLGTIDEVMNSVAFLFSAESSYTTVRP
jgi:NAD(P)-dependent dehydrogenase (short-subunit alcohol dehydrogenase family)